MTPLDSKRTPRRSAGPGRLFAHIGRALPLTALLLAGCRQRVAAHAEVDLATYHRLDAAELEPLRLDKVDSLTLGTSDREVGQITDFAIHGNEYFVLDRMLKSVRVFDHAGHLLRSIGREGHGPGEFSDPTALAFAHDTLFVADPTSGNRLSLFDGTGRFVVARSYGTPGAPVAVAITGERVTTMGVMVPSGRGGDAMTALAVSGRSGEPLGRGCVIDPRYTESREHDGFVSHYDFGSLSVDRDHVYCTQAINPVIQVMDRAGRPVRQIRVAPPFYRPPSDRPLVMNQKAVFDFMSSFTSHVRVFPTTSGFISVYSRFDRAIGENRYHLFVCHGVDSPRCGIVQNVGRPIYVDGQERLYLEEPMELNRPVRVGIYRLVAVHPGAG